jgi:hypothetical protein
VRFVNKSSSEEVRRVVHLQAEAFHTPSPLPLLDATFKAFFAAEVLSEMKKKLKYNPEDRFVCLVVEESGAAPGAGVAGAQCPSATLQPFSRALSSALLAPELIQLHCIL